MGSDLHEAPGLSRLLAEHAPTASGERVSLANIADFLGQRSIGAWLLILALPMVLPVPAPGLSVLFGVPLMIISGQLAMGRKRAWLPEFILKRSMACADYVAWSHGCSPRCNIWSGLSAPARCGLPVIGRRYQSAQSVLCWRPLSHCPSR